MALASALVAGDAAAPEGAAAGGAVRLRVRAGGSERLDTPVEALADGGLVPAGRDWTLIEAGTGARIPAQCDAVGDRTRVRFVLAGRTPAGAEREFTLAPGSAEAAVTVEDGGAVLDVRHRGRPMLCYRKSPVSPPPGVGPLFARNAYLHPVWTPSGTVVTGDFPSDHPHQRGVFLAWTRTVFEGRRPDFWNLGQGSGRVRGVGVDSVVSGPAWGGFRAHHLHEDLKAPGGPVAVLDETWTVTAWAAGGPEAGWWLWDLESEQRTAGGAALRLPAYHYGGMAFRGSDAWVQGPWEFLTSSGRTRQDADGTDCEWADLSGRTGAAWAGLAMIGHPGNIRFPQPLRCHPSVPYFCMAPSQRGPWGIEPGAPLTLRYRFLVHDGRLDAALAQRLCRDFAEPPEVTVEAAR